MKILILVISTLLVTNSFAKKPTPSKKNVKTLTKAEALDYKIKELKYSIREMPKEDKAKRIKYEAQLTKLMRMKNKVKKK